MGERRKKRAGEFLIDRWNATDSITASAKLDRFLELLIQERRFICSFLQVGFSLLPQGYHAYRDCVADFPLSQ